MATIRSQAGASSAGNLAPGPLGGRRAALEIAEQLRGKSPHDMQYGPHASLIAESFTGRLRYSGATLGYQLASVIAGGPAPIIALWLWAGKYETLGVTLTSPFPTKTPFTISAYILLNCVIGFLAVLALKNRQALDHAQEYDEQERAEAGGVRRPAMG